MFFCVVLYGLFHGLCYLPVLLSAIGPAPYESATQSQHDRKGSGSRSPVHPVHPAGLPGDNVSYELAVANGTYTPRKKSYPVSGSTQNGGYPIPPPDYEGEDLNLSLRISARNGIGRGFDSRGQPLIDLFSPKRRPF